MEVKLKPSAAVDFKQRLPPLDCSLVSLPKQITVFHIKKYILKKLRRKYKDISLDKPECVIFLQFNISP
ncbi:MAG: hypothetical protein P4M11_00905 [Candidatus Pacebacteria bacterium]|nr:hypothetical protein [Candidatus Paceibacterota bacterium]